MLAAERAAAAKPVGCGLIVVRAVQQVVVRVQACVLLAAKAQRPAQPALCRGWAPAGQAC